MHVLMSWQPLQLTVVELTPALARDRRGNISSCKAQPALTFDIGQNNMGLNLASWKDKYFLQITDIPVH